MLKSLTIRNFETHLKTDIDFHPGVNVIIGESDEGKSGVVRSIKWNACNRPRGDSYRNDQLDSKKKEDKLKETQVGIVYKNSGLVIRARGGFAGGVNHYQIDSEEPLRALGTDVPDEIQEVSKMKSVNIQVQHPNEQYFLLADRPGQVAKEFNKVAGLTVMDDATAEINSRVRTCNTEIKISEKAVKDKQEEIKNTKWVDSAEKLANKLKSFQAEIVSKEEEYDYLYDKIIHIEEINGVLDTHFQGLDQAIESLKELKKENQDIIDKEYQLNSINSLIRDMKDIDLKLSDTADLKKALNVLNELKTLKNDIEGKEQNRNEINALVYKLEQNRIKETKVTIDLITAQQKYVKIRKEKECPTCGRTGI